MRKTDLLAAIAAVLIATPAMAQSRSRGNAAVPPGQRPAPGMCRVWIDGVPPGQQPAQTDCATAAARVPRNGRVIYGDRPANTRTNNSRFNDTRTNGNQRTLDADRRDDDKEHGKAKHKKDKKHKKEKNAGGDRDN